MKTPAFDHCLRILENWDRPDSAVRDELFFETANFPDEIIIPFRRELNRLLGNKKKNTVRRRQVKTYIDELNRTSKIIEKYLNLNLVSLIDENNKVILRFADNAGTETKFRVFEMVYVIYKKVFDEIQISCKLNDIPFLEICNEVGFPLNTIDTTIAEEHQKNLVSGLHGNSNKANVKSETLIIPGKPDQPGTNTKTGNADQPITIINPKETDLPGGNTTDELNLKNKLKEVGFYNLEMVKYLPKESIEKLIGFIFCGTFPYQIAMLDYLGFIKQFEKDCITRTELYKQLGIMLSVTDRLVQGNINILLPYSKGNKALYTSYTHRERVENDYQKLK